MTRLISLKITTTIIFVIIYFAASGAENISIVNLQWGSFKKFGNHSNLEIEQDTGSVSIYPGKNSPDDSDVHNIVWLETKITPSNAGVLCYMRIYDVDDPATSMIIDSNGDYGGDNNLAQLGGDPGVWVKGESFFDVLPESNDSITSCFTPIIRVLSDNDGFARAAFQSTFQPGDNFRAVAVTARDDLAALSILDSISTMGLALAPPSQADLEQYAVSPLLTVRRRLWVEVDKMGPTPAYESSPFRLVYGPETGVASSIGRNAESPQIYYIADETKETSWTLHSDMYQDSGFLLHERSCYLQPDKDQNYYFNITGITQRDGRPWLTVRTDARFVKTKSGWFLQPRPEILALTDFITTGGTYQILTEDNRVEAKFPTLNHTMDVLARCYVDVHVDPHFSGTIQPWVRNLTNQTLIDYGRVNRRKDPLYWQCYLLGAYEYTILEDGDPDWHATTYYTPVTEGVTVRDVPQDFRYTAIFYEMAAENWNDSQNTDRFLDVKITPHELIHQFDIMHGKGLMEALPDMRELWLRPIDERRIRTTHAP